MSVIYGLEYKKAEKRVKELRTLLLELDSICDTLYNRLEYNGIWETVMKLEDVRVKYYTEFFEHEKIVNLKGKKNV
jgi:predicted patatin/cPLA2 family phospholipase